MPAKDHNVNQLAWVTGRAKVIAESLKHLIDPILLRLAACGPMVNCAIAFEDCISAGGRSAALLTRADLVDP